MVGRSSRAGAACHGLDHAWAGTTIGAHEDHHHAGGQPIDIPGVHCLNPVIVSGRFEERAVPPHYRLVQAHVHQRHMDRWIYRHDLIGVTRLVLPVSP
jgi:hypothetical protein